MSTSTQHFRSAPRLRPRRPWLVVGLSALVGFLLTVVWSAEFVDSTIGGTVADTLLGHDAASTPIAGVGAGVLFAFVSGLAGTFTACNIAAFGAMAPVAADHGSTVDRVRQVLRGLGLLCAGMLPVSAAYGVVVALVGTSMPQFQTTAAAGQLAPRLVQAMVVFGAVGLVMLYLGLAAAGIVPDPLARLARRRPGAPLVLLGALIGVFLIGRPFPLFRVMFRDAAESGDVLYGAAAFVLQSLGNVVLIAVGLLAVTLLAGERLGRWLAADPRRRAALTAAALVAAGVFLVLYWDVRILERRELIPWYPIAPWV
ncbi:hypothetical protein [Goodfellowiella coeruleoviolacea]|uniref:Cytochrome C biogenesis protein transmembrane region n=1 Tax=Goodfellowiella coeruleoviolacea TaxID=334858 RepID=A0AAE3KML2_9PSEU|nr:hypothetical protein [Goodfellowiella coeruleoviolacea]MCP2167738.1 Cytochrome C biogenesis protein transmembrane region [Goodfellowiella coeruleoviolacea]